MDAPEYKLPPGLNVELVAVPPPATYFAPREQLDLGPPAADLGPPATDLGPPAGTPPVEPPPSELPDPQSVDPQSAHPSKDQQVVPPPIGNLQGSNIGQPGGLTAGRVTQVQVGSAWSYGQVGRPPPRQIPICAFCGGMLRDQYTTLGILLAIICFPFGLICCLKFREMRCTVCGR